MVGMRSNAIRVLPAKSEICCIQVAMNYSRGFSEVCAISSVVERLLHTQEVAGSNPASRTISSVNHKCFNCRHLSLKMAEVLPFILTVQRRSKRSKLGAIGSIGSNLVGDALNIAF